MTNANYIFNKLLKPFVKADVKLNIDMQAVNKLLKSDNSWMFDPANNGMYGAVDSKIQKDRLEKVIALMLGGDRDQKANGSIFITRPIEVYDKPTRGMTTMAVTETKMIAQADFLSRLSSIDILFIVLHEVVHIVDMHLIRSQYVCYQNRDIRDFDQIYYQQLNLLTDLRCDDVGNLYNCPMLALHRKDCEKKLYNMYGEDREMFDLYKSMLNQQDFDPIAACEQLTKIYCKNNKQPEPQQDQDKQQQPGGNSGDDSGDDSNSDDNSDNHNHNHIVSDSDIDPNNNNNNNNNNGSGKPGNPYDGLSEREARKLHEKRIEQAGLEIETFEQQATGLRAGMGNYYKSLRQVEQLDSDLVVQITKGRAGEAYSFPIYDAGAAQRGVILPTRRPKGTDVALFVDVSGSVISRKKVQNRLLSDLLKIAQNENINSVVFICYQSKVVHHVQIDGSHIDMDTIIREARIGGGTCFDNAVTWMLDEMPKLYPHVTEVYNLTDGEDYLNNDRPRNLPMTWLATDDKYLLGCPAIEKTGDRVIKINMAD